MQDLGEGSKGEVPVAVDVLLQLWGVDADWDALTLKVRVWLVDPCLLAFPRSDRWRAGWRGCVLLAFQPFTRIYVLRSGR